jgi:hypothetical protein
MDAMPSAGPCRPSKGIRTQSGREDVGAGLGDLPRLGPQFGVELQDPLDRLVDRQPFGSAREFSSRPDPESTRERQPGLGLGREGFDAEVRGPGLSTQAKDLVPGLRDEYGVELFYNLRIAPGCHLTPDFQVIHPGLAPVDTALMLRVRLKVDF